MIRKLANGIVTTIASNQETTYAGEIAVDGAGVIYVGESGAIYTVGANGSLTPYTGRPQVLANQFGPVPGGINGPDGLAVNRRALGVSP